MIGKLTDYITFTHAFITQPALVLVQTQKWNPTIIFWSRSVTKITIYFITNLTSVDKYNNHLLRSILKANGVIFLIKIKNLIIIY